MLHTIALLTLLVAGQAQTDKAPHSRPPWQRTLEGEEATRATDLEESIYRLMTADDFKGAQEAAEQAALLRAKAQGADHWQAQDARRLVAEVSKWSKSSELLRESVSLHDEAERLEEKYRHADALPLRQRLLEIRRRVLGEDDYKTAVAFCLVGHSFREQTRLSEAEAAYRTGLEIVRRTLGEEHPETAAMYTNLGQGLEAQGKFSQAADHLDRALKIRLKVLGEEHGDTAGAYNNYAVNLANQGRTAEATPLTGRP